jgi:hypothetical protein
MAVNFKIKTSHDGDALHLKLAGDFDGSSAWVLLNNIADDGVKIRRIFINTNGLKEVHPFGKAIFEKQIRSIKKSFITLIFLGKHAERIAPMHTEYL